MWAEYAIEGISSSFRLRAANVDNGSKFTCELTGMSTLCNRKGTIVDIGHFCELRSGQQRRFNGTSFVLSGVDGAWGTSSSSQVGPWKSKSLSYIGDRDLHSICIPSSHDSGMSTILDRTPPGTFESALVTQYRSVGEQLKLGIRYLDIRPAKWNGVFYCAHLSYVDVQMRHAGGIDQSMDDIVTKINEFTEQNSELIILNISHDF